MSTVTEPPRRTAASSVLWGHLLSRKPITSSTKTAPGYPPIAPLDRNGTSVRILLHDTQANLEKFSIRVEQLTSRVEDAKKEVSSVHNTFKSEQEQAGTEMVELVDRCQTRIQESLGQPAQVMKVEELRQQLLAIDRRIEQSQKDVTLIQSTQQTQLQILQTQSQALQTMQEQHTHILAAIVPLLPLIQSIPLHIETARGKLNESLLNTQNEWRHVERKRRSYSPDAPNKRRRRDMDSADEAYTPSGDSERNGYATADVPPPSSLSSRQPLGDLTRVTHNLGGRPELHTSRPFLGVGRSTSTRREQGSSRRSSRVGRESSKRRKSSGSKRSPQVNTGLKSTAQSSPPSRPSAWTDRPSFTNASTSSFASNRFPITISARKSTPTTTSTAATLPANAPMTLKDRKTAFGQPASTVQVKRRISVPDDDDEDDEERSAKENGGP